MRERVDVEIEGRRWVGAKGWKGAEVDEKKTRCRWERRCLFHSLRRHPKSLTWRANNEQVVRSQARHSKLQGNTENTCNGRGDRPDDLCCVRGGGALSAVGCHVSNEGSENLPVSACVLTTAYDDAVG